jgi:zinc/manganese transport system substrate-binding protein
VFRTPRLLRRHAVAVGFFVGAFALSACGSSPAATSTAGTSGRTTSGHIVRVAAAENFWGSIASQIGGVHVQVTSIITNPETDPHTYEPTTTDAITLSNAQFVVVNGIGYDPWVSRLLAADQGHPTVLDVGSLLGIPDGGNPHRWYNPEDVERVIATMVADLQSLDPSNSTYFAKQATHFETVSLRTYHALITSIRTRYAGTEVGASESIFAMLSPVLGLDLITPPGFLRAISEGTDPSASNVETIDNQIKDHQIKIYVYNSQNVTPDVQAQLNQVKAEHIPFTTITETLAPASSTYEAWQTKELRGIKDALGRAARRSS